MRLPEIARLPVLADIVAKGFLGWRSIFFRTTDAFRSTRYEGPHRFTKTTRELRIGVTEYCSGHVGQKTTFARFLTSFDFRLLQHGVIPGSSQTKARESALQERMRPASCGLATMESGNGVLCRTGRVVEANIDLRGEWDRSCVRASSIQILKRSQFT